MISLEAIKAKHGDCLLLQWGTAAKKRTALIDGGPSSVYADFLRDRIEALAGSGKLELELVMLSHIDDDHINGLLDFAKEVEDGDAPDVVVRALWHNTLEGLLDDPLTERTGTAATAAIEGALAMPPGTSDVWTAKVIASVPQGQQLGGFATRLGWKLNPGFPNKLVMRGGGKDGVKIKGLELTVVAPAVEELETLRKFWKKLRKKDITAAYSDDSPYNLSSIVVLAEFGGRRILLTGDARGDLVLQGLDELGLLDADGAIHVDVLKLPHHGSRNNVEPEFFERVTADHYVVSGDRVKFPNPAKDTMKMLHAARGDDDYKVYCTYAIADMKTLFKDKLVTPAAGETSVIVKLKDKP